VSTVDKVKALISRATNETTPTEEARTSAMIACKLIARDDLLAAAPAPRASRPKRDPYEDFYRGPNRGAWPPPPPPRPKPDLRTIRARYGGTCHSCHRPFPEGAEVVWAKGKGSAHVACRAAWEATL
jgi:hypothetical protein